MTMIYHEWSAVACSNGLAVCGWRLREAPHTPPHMATGSPPSEQLAPEPALPDGCPELLLNFGDPFEHHAADGTVRTQPRAFLVGQITRPFDVRPTGKVDLVAVRFEAYGAWSLTAPHAPPTDDWIDAHSSKDTMRSVQQLWNQLAPLDDGGREQVITDWLAQHVRMAPRADEVVTACVQALRASGGAASIESLADHNQVALRTLQRRFQAQLGVSPKLFARIVRFHRVCSAWRREPSTLAQVAADSGYCDESHLVRDFRAFVGEPPATFLSALPAFTALFIPHQ
ncbi:MAG TPA: helix-turn-helix domain-containing protein [Gemmatimonas sp.]|uniref:AraC family transcriptional regulator n=1 Tax=Gemmatimonas sp. TaxID=1962908 RepID=UPI002ED79580